MALQAIADAGLGRRDRRAGRQHHHRPRNPSLDALLINRVDFRPDIERLPIFGFGCGGGVAGLARAARLASAAPGSNVLFLTIDLCSLCLRVNDPSVEMFVAGALFGDGAAGIVLSAPEAGEESSAGLGTIIAGGEHFWPGTERIMGWDVLGDGFGVVLQPGIAEPDPHAFCRGTRRIPQAQGLNYDEFEGFLLHPGGRKVLETAGKVLGLSPHELRHSWQVLKDFGNMSSATALFVLAEAVRSGATGRHLLAAFGPGFSAYFAVLDSDEAAHRALCRRCIPAGRRRRSQSLGRSQRSILEPDLVQNHGRPDDADDGAGA